jgi:hypothetical protein
LVGKNHPQGKADSVAQVVSEPVAIQPQQSASQGGMQPTPQGSPSSEERQLQDKKDP